MTKIKFLAALLISAIYFAQNGNVGINTEEPAVTFHVTGQPSNANVLDGLLTPRLTGAELAAKNYTTLQTGTLVYVTQSAPNLTGQVINVNEPGYYFFDGVIWQASSGADWHTTGNAGTKAFNFIGTTDDANLIFKRNSVVAGSLRRFDTSFGAASLPLSASPNGGANSAFGVGALGEATTGTYNDAFGYNALNKLTSGTSNSGFGNGALQAATTASYNSGSGVYSLFRLTTGNYNTGSGTQSLPNLSTGYKNTVAGAYAGQYLTTGAYNTIVGFLGGERIADANKKNTLIGANTGAYVQGDNNVFIGVLAGRSNTTTAIETVNNRLVIHSNVNSAISTGPEVVSDLSSSYTNGLIIGDFAQRWVRFNGSFQLNPSYTPTADSDFTKIVRYNPTTGALGESNYIEVPPPPAGGNYTLKAIDGAMHWVAD